MQILERELRSDLELEEEEQLERGVPPEEASYAARRAFGNIALIREQTHEAWGLAPVERFWQDLPPRNALGTPERHCFPSWLSSHSHLVSGSMQESSRC